MLLGLELVCPTCSQIFRYCEHCWRGHKYCSPGCSIEGRKRNRRITEKRYSSSVKGIQSRRKRQKNFRSRQILRSKVTDHSPKVEIFKIDNTNKLNRKVHEHCCGCSNPFQLVSYGSLNACSEKNDYFSFVRFRSKHDGLLI